MCYYYIFFVPAHLVDNPRKYECDKCNRRYKHRGSLSNHKNFECSKEPKFQCPYCHHKTKRKDHLKLHIGIRHGPDML